MPRMISPPYQNNKLQTRTDAVVKRRAQNANKSVLIENEKLSLSMQPPLTTNSRNNFTRIGASITNTPSRLEKISQTPGNRRNNSLADVPDTVRSSLADAGRVTNRARNNMFSSLTNDG